MCGRYTIELTGDHIQQRFHTENTVAFNGTYNAAPTDELPIITYDDKITASLATWGLRPAWADDQHDGFINARIETADEKPSFKDAWQKNRCLIPATGFYEWTGESGGKTPHYISPDRDTFSFAGIHVPGGNPTHAVLTMPATPDVSTLHDRVPVILRREEEGSWLTRRVGKDTLLTDRPGLTHHPVTKAVNTPSNDAAFLTEPR